MKLLVQWATAHPKTWVEIDSSEWSSLPKKPVPIGTEIIDDKPGWLHNICIQGMGAGSADHVAVEQLGDSVCLTVWNDDPKDYESGEYFARVLIFHPLKPDPRLGGAINTDIESVMYAGPKRLARLKEQKFADTELRPWSEFTPPPEEITRHGIWLNDDLHEAHRKLAKPVSWREWGEGGTVPPQRELGFWSKAKGTITYYWRNGEGSGDDAASDITPAIGPNCKLTENTTTVYDIEHDATKRALDEIGFAFTTETNVPNVLDWPSGDYRAQIDINGLESADIWAKVQLLQVDFSGSIQDAIGTSSNFTTVGTHLFTQSSYDPPTGSSTDRYQVRVLVTCDSSKQLLITLGVRSTDSFADGPWAIQTIDSDERNAKTKGIDTDLDSRNARTKGQVTDSDSRNAKTKGQVTDSDSRNAKTKGIDTDLDSRNARTKGQVTNSDSRNAKTKGQVTDSDSRNAKTKGVDTDSAFRNAKTVGQVTDSASRNAKTKGNATDSAFRNARTKGKVTDSSSRNAKTKGGITDLDLRNAKTKGRETDSDSRNARIKGQVTDSDSRNAKTKGQVTDSANRNAKTKGKATDSASRNVRIKGGVTDSDNRNAKTKGGVTSSDSRNAKTKGFSDSTEVSDTRGARIRGAVWPSYVDHTISKSSILRSGVTFEHIVPAGDNRFILVTAGWCTDDAAGQVEPNACIYNGETLPQIWTYTYHGLEARAWGRVVGTSDTSTTGDVVIAMDAEFDPSYVVAANFVDVDQSYPYGRSVGATVTTATTRNFGGPTQEDYALLLSCNLADGDGSYPIWGINGGSNLPQQELWVANTSGGGGENEDITFAGIAIETTTPQTYTNSLQRASAVQGWIGKTIGINPPHWVGPNYIDHTIDKSTDARSSATFEHIVPAGTNRYIVVNVNLPNDGDCSGVTYDGNDLTVIISESGGAYGTAKTYGKALGTSAVSTTGDVVVTSSTGNWVCDAQIAVNFTNVDQDDPIGCTDGGNGGASVAPVEYITETNNSLLFYVGMGQGDDAYPMLWGSNESWRAPRIWNENTTGGAEDENDLSFCGAVHAAPDKGLSRSDYRLAAYGGGYGIIGLVLEIQGLHKTGARNAKTKGKATDSAGRNAKTKGVQPVSDSRNAKTKGFSAGTEDSDTRNAKTKGLQEISDIRSARTLGKATDSDNRNAKTKGQVTDSDNRNAKTKGVETLSDSRNARIKGDVTDSDSRNARIKGQVTDSDSRNAKTKGIANVDSDSRNAKTKGSIAVPDSRSAKTKGVDTSSDARNAKTKGSITLDSQRNATTKGVSTESNARNAKTKGDVTPSDSRNAKTKGIETLSDSRNAKTIGQATDSASRNAKTAGSTTSSDNRNAKTKGIGITDSDTREAVTKGVATDSDSRNAKTKGSEQDSDSRNAKTKGNEQGANNRNAKTKGVATGSDSRGAKVSGGILDSSARNAKTKGSGIQDLDSRNAKTKGVETLSDGRNAKTKGGVTDSDNRNAKTKGQVTDSDNRNAKTKGIDTDSDSRNAKTKGIETLSDSRNAKTKGAAVKTSDFRNAKTKGGVTTSDSRNAKTKGAGILDSDSRNAKTKGQATDSDSRNAKTKGIAVVSSSRNVRTKGEAATASDFRSAKTKGEETLSDGRFAKTKGEETLSDSRNARTKGQITASDSRNAKTKGVMSYDVSSSRNAKTKGVATYGINSRNAKTKGLSIGSRCKQIRLALITHVNQILYDAGFTAIDVKTSYSTDPPTLPAVSVTSLNMEGEYAEVGSRKNKGNALFAVDVICRGDGERSDICDIIYRDSTKIYLIETKETLAISDIKQLKLINLYRRYEGIITLEVIDNKCVK